MEDQLIALIGAISSSSSEEESQAKRRQAEIDLKRARTNPVFPTALVNIASHAQVDLPIRQMAMTTLHKFISQNWGQDEDHDGDGLVDIPDATRTALRASLLELALSTDENKKIKSVTSYCVGKIASYDFPDRWPDLLPSLFNVVPAGNDAQVYGALKILSDVIEESLSEDQFFGMARDIVKAVTQIAFDEARRPNLRALAISIFRGCFDLMDIVKDDHPTEVKAFADEMLKEWLPFFTTILKAPLPEAQTSGILRQPETWDSIVSIKMQVVKTLLKVKTVFPNLLTPHSTTLFSAVWEELARLQQPYEDLYILNAAQGRMEDTDALPYTLDYLVVEELDFLNQCFRAPPVQAELATQLSQYDSASKVPWMTEVMRMLVSYSRIGCEEQDLWDVDCSLYLVEETSASANYTARIAASDLLIKLGEWYSHNTIDALFSYTQSLFPADKAPWKTQEAALFLFSMLLSDFQDMDKSIPQNITEAYLAFVDFTINQPQEPYLRARGYLLGGSLTRAVETPPALLDRTIACITTESEEVVQLSCIKALEYFMRSSRVPQDRQVLLLTAISQYMTTKDPEDLEELEELVVTLAETIRLAINLDPRIVINNQEVQSVDLLFVIAKHGSANFQALMLVTEGFEDIVRTLSQPEAYAALCTKVLPTLIGAFGTASVTDNDPLVTTATELLTVLIQYGSEPLPPQFVAAVLPRLKTVLLESTEGEVLRPGAEAVKYLLVHDHHQVFSWSDETGSSGLEVCLRIIDRLLGPSIEDNSASEVGGLAAELVEKAGHDRLGPYLPQLLRAVAHRLASAEAAQFIQSLILVFARLSLVGAHDVVDFLSQTEINGQSGLQVVLSKWLENSINFAGYDEIRQNVIALSKLYSLNDPRLAQTQVKGDLIPNEGDGRIMTRSRAKANPDKFTVIPATLKIIKVLIEELLSASGATAASNAAAAAAAAAQFDDDDKDDDGWEDEPDTLDLSLGTTKEDLMSFLESGGGRQRDDETQAYLSEFFVRAARDNVANFQDWYSMLGEEEQGKLQQLAAPGQ
ncbi:armadillo-type protein [Plectosphaerella cucumerina]|uniref:Armadillo-type protein n=1 Tax=Plectosphaerella cucumerina TaxID=40658 RepID=A0A8K0TPB2_9PEZI|nr:armadillo-type protein [Plectosphaerella cucumerina]